MRLKNSIVITSIVLTLFLFAAVPVTASAERTEPIISDHTCTVLEDIPQEWIEAAKDQLRLSYGHTSHGSQPVTGMQVLMDDPTHGGLYDFTRDGTVIDGALSIKDWTPTGDLGYSDWPERTRAYLDGAGYDRNVVIWSWCGQVSSADEAYIDLYLSQMAQLESEYPDVTFVYMTGHLNGTGTEGNLNQRNNQIRNFCLTNDKILFDFADIESYDPDGTGFLDLGATDSCNYNGGNWADEWCADNPGSPLCYDCDCAHSRALNCNLKGRAFWWMLARIAGWQADPIQCSIGYSPSSLEFTALQDGAPPASQTLEIWCEGNGTLDWTTAEMAGWLALSPTSGSSTGEHDLVTIEVDATGLQEGTYDTIILISDPDAVNSPQTVPVSLTVTSTNTLACDLACQPASGTLPLRVQFTTTLTNSYTGFSRRLAGRLDVELAGGNSITSWRAGSSNIGPGESVVNLWYNYLPANPMMLGKNTFTFAGVDVTPAPFNQPPYPPSGHSDQAICSVDGLAP